MAKRNLVSVNCKMLQGNRVEHIATTSKEVVTPTGIEPVFQP